MKKLEHITVPRVDRLESNNFEDSRLIVQACLLVLNKLAAPGPGAVFAGRDRVPGGIKWLLSSETQFAFSYPGDSREVLEVSNGVVFSSMVARLGSNRIEDVYLGAGLFELSLEGDTSSVKKCAIFVSNFRETGYWIKLQRCS